MLTIIPCRKPDQGLALASCLTVSLQVGAGYSVQPVALCHMPARRSVSPLLCAWREHPLYQQCACEGECSSEVTKPCAGAEVDRWIHQGRRLDV